MKPALLITGASGFTGSHASRTVNLNKCNHHEDKSGLFYRVGSLWKGLLQVLK